MSSLNQEQIRSSPIDVSFSASIGGKKTRIRHWKVQTTRIKMTPPQTFALISLLIITAMVVATGLIQSSFYRQAIIDRESVLVRDFVDAFVLEQVMEGELNASDLQDYAQAQNRLNHTFVALDNLSGIVRTKVFNTADTIIWSDERHLIGTKLTRHKADLVRAMAGEVRAVFLTGDETFDAADPLPRGPLIEFYVPFSVKERGSKSGSVNGVLALYRSPQELTDTIRKGLFILWSACVVTGIILFAALYRLFRSVYYRQREAESQFTKLSTYHEQLVQIEKLSAMGQIVSEIAHQLNNPLVGVTNLAELAEREENNPTRTKELLAEIRNAGNHCRDFVQRMLRFNQVAHSEPHPTEVKALVNETITFITQSVDGHPVVTFEAPSEEVILDIDPVLMRHALFNLIHNATQAGPGTPVAVSLASVPLRGVPGWQLTVSDNGPGIKPDVAAKLFTPFFTTRSGGTGLGLSVAQQIVLQHGGHIHAENQPGGGALFIIWLPAQRHANEIKSPDRR
ncbi:MAG: HAMP domain-containing sensor histidine kinase [Proteobacteria bacterium]|nr:HAMP domain-containing sensor histidine kinase [Pseudomonadota bacterium]